MQLVANMSLQEVTSPFYPSFYISQTLEWIISPMYARQVVTLQVLDLDLDEEDYIIVRHDNIDGEVMAIYNTTGGPGTVISVSQLHLMMKVKTFYPRRSHRGFKFSYIQGCDVTVNDDKGVVSSPGYGVLNYPAYQNCSWTITAQQSRQLTIIFDENFHLEDDKDFLQVYDGLNDTGVPLHYNNSVGFSGRIAPPPLTSTSGRLYINLRSNSLYQYTGYRARFSIGCPDPGFNNNTEIIPYPSTYAFGSYLNVSCESGYVFLEEENQRGDNTSVEYVVMECLYGGVWNVARIPQCQARYCGVPPVINRGYLLQGNGVQYGATVTYVCEDGYIPSNRLTLACQGNGTWEPAPECHAVNCSVPPDVANATFVIQEGTGWNFGSRILYTCDSGFHLSGAAILFCLANGTWNEDTPSCNRISCPTPDIDHGQLDTPGPVMRYGDIATLDCAAGFTVVGTSTVTCLANQTLGTLPSCEDVDECGDRTVCDVTSQECVNTVGSYSCRCKLGYADNGTHVCQGMWICMSI
ncbi:CUB and sushi domain-containing protein 3-like [Argopecten irradians]|uniref:CUB and sushi domain-containing protein 3-like n=1 Tax=Argopecten irradians TaxID=31199 RepID=UPI003724C164